MLLKRLVVGPIQENCYIIGSDETRRAIVVDPGDDSEFIIEHIQKDGLTVPLIVNTHAHPDHIGAIAAVQRATGAKFALHKDELVILEDRLSKTPPWRPTPIEPVQPDILLEDDATLEVKGLQFKVIHTPGHTPGAICLYGYGVLFTGDTLFQGSIGRTDFMGGNFEQIMASLRNKLMVLPDETVVLPGHGPQTTIGDEKLHNPFLNGASMRLQGDS